MANEAKKVKKSAATGKKSAAKKSNASDKPLWVWKLSWEDMNELETCVTLYRDEARAMAAMEADIRRLADEGYEGSNLEREDALHATLDDRFTWAITKVEVH